MKKSIIKSRFELSIIIKALNEEANIVRCIKSAIKASKGIKTEIILADCLSTDKTIELASKFNIKIVQLIRKQDRSCGMGAQLGFVNTKSKYVYILDADMELNPDFLKKGIKYLDSDPKLAGVGGIIEEMAQDNIVFKKRLNLESASVAKKRFVDKLMMGGLYRKSAIDYVGYFSNQFFHAYEESDLGNRLITRGYKLIRISAKMVKHYGEDKSGYKITFDRWKSRYLWGCGEYLRFNLFNRTYYRVIKELKIYLFVLIWWFLFVVSLKSPFFQMVLLNGTTIFLLLFLIKKRSLKEFAFSIFSWNMTALGLLAGFLKIPKNPFAKIRYRVIK